MKAIARFIHFFSLGIQGLLLTIAGLGTIFSTFETSNLFGFLLPALFLGPLQLADAFVRGIIFYGKKAWYFIYFAMSICYVFFLSTGSEYVKPWMENPYTEWAVVTIFLIFIPFAAAIIYFRGVILDYEEHFQSPPTEFV